MNIGMAALFLVLVAGAAWMWRSARGGTEKSSIRPAGFVSKHPRDRIKQATQLKKDGRLDEACELLKETLAEWERDPPRTPDAQIPEDYPEVKVYWKLANYLQRAGRSEEGWKVLERLQREEYPRLQRVREYYERLEREGPDHALDRPQIERMLQREPEDTLYTEKAHIFDKTRLFLKRENRSADALRYALLSKAASVLGFWYAARSEPVVQKRYEEESSPEAIRENVSSAVEKLGHPDGKEPLVDILTDWIDAIPEVSLGDLDRKIRTIVESPDASD